jgi:hypothetical protein
MASQQKEQIDITGYGLNSEQREQVADLVVERIVNRTVKDNVDWRGKKFPAYSDEYKASLDFKIAGKGKRVDLQLSGDMLAALKILKVTQKSIVVGYDKGTEENARAEGNILGSYGGDPNPKKARDFLGITDNELLKIIKYVKKNV